MQDEISGSILITGASSGIGRAIALALADRQESLVLSGRDEHRLGDAVRAVKAAGGVAVSLTADLMKEEETAHLIKESEAMAPLQSVIHAAGAARFGRLTETPTEDWQFTLDQNMTAPFRLFRAALEVMGTRGAGRLILINSVAAFRTFPFSSAYVAAKHGMKGFTNSLREEARTVGVSVSVIYPGATSTEWWEKLDGDFPQDRMLDPEKVGRAVRFIMDMDDETVVEELIIRHKAGDF